MAILPMNVTDSFYTLCYVYYPETEQWCGLQGGHDGAHDFSLTEAVVRKRLPPQPGSCGKNVYDPDSGYTGPCDLQPGHSGKHLAAWQLVARDA